MKTLKEMFARKVKAPVVTITTAFAVSLVATSAHAAYTMPAVITTAFADMVTAWSAIEDLVWPVVAAVLIGMFVIRKAKQGANKA